MPTDFALPELGENVTTGDVLRVLVKPGDTIARDQPVLELETDKATIEVPSAVAGRVKTVQVKSGDKVKVGQTILTVEDGASQGRVEADSSRKSTAPPPPAIDAPESSIPTPAPAQRQRIDEGKVVDISRGARPAQGQDLAPAPEPGISPAPAAPSVRRMARELGVDINVVRGSGPGGRISAEDVKTYTRQLVGGMSPAALASVEALPDFSRWGEVERQPMRAVRRKTAAHVAAAWTAIPHVTQHDAADITDLEALRRRYAPRAEAAGGSLTLTAIAIKVAASALRVFPRFNASIDAAAEVIILKKYVHIGVAVDTDRGLLVPVIRHADAKNIIQLSVELSQISQKARDRKLSLEEMQGGCFTITNLGGIGGTAFTPIVNAPELAILGIARARMEPVYVPSTDSPLPRLMLPLSLSYDHRVIDGADAARFLRWIAEALEQPFMLALQG